MHAGKLRDLRCAEHPLMPRGAGYRIYPLLATLPSAAAGPAERNSVCEDPVLSSVLECPSLKNNYRAYVPP